MKSFTLAESLSNLAAERAANCTTAQGRAVWREIMPIVQPDPPDLAAQLEAKIAAMFAIPPVEPSPKKERKPRFRNGMAAIAEWEEAS
jgi:RNA polymerase subunit RPABC4/transcription elongation factor Spt4